ncbi:MAG: PD-(D/E)XK nuclease family protein [Clostridia bacterium]|nr:PD-(D/E)XK nuclease family protein [Clostridia bacterium]
MLHFILGRLGAGKTTAMHRKLKELTDSGKSAVFIVPEQYSFYTEKNMVELLGARKAHMVEVVSFSFMARNILKKYGLNSKTSLDDSTRVMLMSLALEQVGDKLEIYGRHKNSASLVKRMLKLVKELRQASISSEKLRETADLLNESVLQSKLKEAAIVEEAYSAIVSQSYFDDESAPEKLCNVLKEHDEFSGKTVFFDGFRGFTQQELNVLELIVRQADEAYISLCLDRSDGENDFDAFAHTRRTLHRVVSLARKNDIKIAPYEYISNFDNQRFKNEELKTLESALYSDNSAAYDEKTENIVICSAENFEAECDYVACTVKNLLRTENMRCRDIAIISRSEENYSRQIRACLKKYGVPVFEDKRQSVAYHPLMEFICSAVDIAARGFSVDSVMRILKTGLTDLTIDEISALENYALMWNINSGRWLEEWVGHPDGLGAKMTDSSAQKLAEINEIRVKAIARLARFRDNFREIDGLKAAQEIFSLLTDMNVPQHLMELAVNFDGRGENQLACEQNRIWELAVDMLDRIAFALAEVRMTPARFSELLNLIVSTYTVGTLPQGLDEIMIGSADRVKTSAPKIVFAVGVNDGLFPMIPKSNDILTDNERKILADYDLNIDDSLEMKLAEERFIAYSTLCCASERVYLTYSRKGVSGEEMSESELVTQVRRIFPNAKEVDTICIPDIDKIEGEAPAFELLAKKIRNGGDICEALQKYFTAEPEYADKLKALRRAVKNDDFSIKDKDTAKELFGMNMYMSASRTEVYHKCPFEYFCMYGLNAKPRKSAELDPMQKGTALHFILERLISAYGSDGLCKMEKAERDKHIQETLVQYFEENLGAAESLGERFGYLFNQLGVIACEVVDRLVAEFSVCEFVPTAFELKIDVDGEVGCYEIPLPDGGILKIKGSVDRVDTMQSGEQTFVRVIDYKSGGKNFDLSEVFSGLNMQMLIYLFAIWKNGFRDSKDIVPAGVLYMPVKAPVVTTERDGSEEEINSEKLKSVKMSGMVLNDSRVIYAMDSDHNGRFVPAKITKSGENSGTLITIGQMGLLMKRVEKILSDMAMSLHDGKIPVMPAHSDKSVSAYKNVCEFCDYSDVCCSDEDTPVREIEYLSHKDSLNLLGGEEDA